MPEVRFKPAKVTVERDKYMLAVGQTKKQILVGEINDAASIRKLVGKKDVEVAISGRTIVAIGRRAIAPCYYILCYYPIPDIYKQILPRIRRELVQQYIDAGVIDKKLGEELQAGF